MAKFIDANGAPQEFPLNGMLLYKEASAKKISVRQLINQKCPTRLGDPDAFQQMCMAAGLRFRHDDNLGIPAANLADIMDGAQATTFIPADAIPDSRILFPAALMEVIEDQLQSREDAATGAFESLVGYRATVASNRIEQPVISYSGSKGPEDSQFERISQNTRPPIMLSLTSSDISRRIPTTSIGMEISQEALQANSLDFVAMTMTRFLKIANYNEWITQLGLILAGDPDASVTPMDNGTLPLVATKAVTYDAALAGLTDTLTQLAWLNYLYHLSMVMTKTHVVCDMACAMAVENRTNRPTIQQNNSVDRIDVPFRVIYPAFQQNLDMLIMPAGSFPAHTMMGLEKGTALSKITSSTASYSAIEDVVMKKSRELRLDRGFIIYRNYTSSFDVMTLIP